MSPPPPPNLGPWGFGHLALAPVTSPFTAHPNGALVPQEPADVVEAREAHLAPPAAQAGAVPGLLGQQLRLPLLPPSSMTMTSRST